MKSVSSMPHSGGYAIIRSSDEMMHTINPAHITEIINRIVQAVSPDQVILFGSAARGENRQDSDLDLLIIKESDEPRYCRAVPIYHILRDIMVPIDIIVYTPAEIKEWSQVRQAFITTAIREGKVLYEKKA